MTTTTATTTEARRVTAADIANDLPVAREPRKWSERELREASARATYVAGVATLQRHGSRYVVVCELADMPDIIRAGGVRVTRWDGVATDYVVSGRVTTSRGKAAWVYGGREYGCLDAHMSADAWADWRAGKAARRAAKAARRAGSTAAPAPAPTADAPVAPAPARGKSTTARGKSTTARGKSTTAAGLLGL